MSPRGDAAVLAYGGMHWSEREVFEMPCTKRRWYVEWLEKQLEREKKAQESKG